MKPNEYLNETLKRQTFDDDDQELKDLRRHRKEIERKLRAAFSDCRPSIQWAGSMAKTTMIRESYDGDMTCYFPEGETGAGEVLKDIYDNVADVLSEDYDIERKNCAIRVRMKDESKTDLHIDVVPGRFTNGTDGDVFLHQTEPEKERLKTNLATHVDHIKDSGVVPAIRLLKLWRVGNGLTHAKTFVLELLVVKLLEKMKSAGLSIQLTHVWEQLRDHAESMSVEDPANPQGNDLKPLLDQCRDDLSRVAADTLELIDESGWEDVFGQLDDVDDDAKRAALGAVAASVTNPTRPWCGDE